MALKLTDTRIKSLKYSDGGEICDGNRLYLKITKTNTKSWVFIYKIKNKRTKLGLGAYPIVSLKLARDKAYEYNQLLSNGQDPKLQKELFKSKEVIPPKKDMI